MMSSPPLISQLVDGQMSRTPDATALIIPTINGKTNLVTYRELDEKANRIARYLMNTLGIACWEGTLVGIHLHRSLESIATLLALVRLGCPYVPLDPVYPRAHLEHIVSTAGLQWLISDTSTLDSTGLKLPSGISGITVDLSSIELTTLFSGEPLSPHPNAPGSGEDPLLYVLFTSGSSGPPKGVCGPHSSTVNRLDWMQKKYPLDTTTDVFVHKTTLNFVDHAWEVGFDSITCELAVITSLVSPLCRVVTYKPSILTPPKPLPQVWAPLTHGCPLLILDNAFTVNIEFMVAALAIHKATRITVVPSLLRALLFSYPELDNALPQLQQWTVSGESLKTSLALEFTEACPGHVLINPNPNPKPNWRLVRDIYSSISMAPPR